jgi:cytochrome c biogenesis protein CcmG, thiol:disulfide interchange protein DsbE
MPMPTPQPSPARPAWLDTALVVAASLAIGYFVLPQLRPGAASLRGQDAPDFVLPVIHGGETGSRLRLSDLRGRVVVLDFWASWCPSCRKQAPALDQLAAANPPDQVLVIGVNTGEAADQGAAYAQSRNFSYPVVHDDGDRVAATYDVNTLPLLVVVDPRGRVSAARQGGVSASELAGLVAEARGK